MLVVEECVIETDLELLIPDSYVSNVSERLSLYSQLDNVNEAQKLQAFEQSLADRFGPIPDTVKNLINSVKLRWHAADIGFEKVSIKNEIMKCYLSSKKDEKYLYLIRKLHWAERNFMQNVPWEHLAFKWDENVAHFRKVMPTDYRRVLEERKAQAAGQDAGVQGGV